MNTLFIFGFGYSASLFAKQAVEKGWRVRATTRSAQTADGVDFFSFDGHSKIVNATEAFDGVTHILHSIAPDKEKGDAVFNLHAQDLEKIPTLQWMGYLSTTGVYGNHDGAMVDETSLCHPSSARSIARKKAEEDWLSSSLPVHLFRLAGIYGPGRNVFHQIKKGQARAIDKAGHKFSRIHRDDIAGVLWASIEKPAPKSAYNICDDEPLEPVHVLNTACELLGVEMPPVKSFEEAAQSMSPMAKTFWLDNKTCNNQKMKTELGYQLKYPDHKSGLRAIMKEENL